MALLCAALAGSAAGLAPAALNDAHPRIAFVIGNANYRNAPLANPVNDANAISIELRQMGFEVVELVNASHDGMRNGIASIETKLKGRDAIALLFYAGHGVQLDWRNYLIPVDADMKSASDARLQAIPVDSVLSAFVRANTAMNIVVLDACRDNPFSGGSTGKGLAQMDAPTRTLLAYATAPGNYADDGEAGHGLYTESLLSEMQRPGTRIEDIFKRVRVKVRVTSHGRQIPWESTSLEDDFYFLQPGQSLIPAPAPEPQRFEQGGVERERVPPAPAPEPQRVERQSATPAPASEEERYEQERAELKKTEHLNTPDGWAAYLDRFPSGLFAEVAQYQLDRLEKPEVEPQGSPLARDPLPEIGPQARGNRFREGDVFVWDETDDYTGVTKRIRHQVTEADDQHVVFNRGALVLDQMGNVLRNAVGTKDPALNEIPSELVIGKTWHTAFRNVNTDTLQMSFSYYDFRITSRESVSVPAGEFQAYRIEGRGYSKGGSDYVTLWIDPKSFQVVKRTVKTGLKNSYRYTQALVSGPWLAGGQ